MTYTVNYSDSAKTAITVGTTSIDTTTNIGLIGQGYTNFGETMAENLLHILENFADDTAPTKPIEGQIWYDTATNALSYMSDTIGNGGTWQRMANIIVQITEPSGVGEQDGYFWLQSSTGNLYVRFSGSWQQIASASATTKVVPAIRFDTVDAAHDVIETHVNGVIVSITSADATSWIPQGSGGNIEYLPDGSTLLTTVFPSIRQGVTLNSGTSFVFHGTATSANYADLAERYAADAIYMFGTVVKLGGSHEITMTTDESDTGVFGVVSDNPAFMMNAGAGDSSTHPYIALSGRLPVKIVGQVSKGDRLMSSSIPGTAIKASDDSDYRTIIGRAVKDKLTDDAGYVEVAVGVK